MHAKTNILNQAGLASDKPPAQPDSPPGKAVVVRWQQPAENCPVDQLRTEQSWVTFDSSRQSFAAALQEACEKYPGQDLILLRADISLPENLLQRLRFWRQQLPDTDAITVLSNWHPAFNPFGQAGHLPEPPDEADLDALVANTSHKRLYAASHWPEHLLWIKADAAQRLSGTERQLNDTLPERVGLRLIVADDIFARCSTCAVLQPAPRYDWDLPPAFPAEYRQNALQQLLADNAWSLCRIDPAEQPVMLHITHSWGGGVGRWVTDYCNHDVVHTHLVLQSRGFWKKKQYGTQLTLHQQKPDGPQLAEWWLAPGIFSTEIHNQQYREILDAIQRCHGVSRVLVSSLIGHSLDALRCPLPTIQVMHDYYPAWPLLSIPPGGTNPDQINLESSLASAADSELEFIDRDSRDWNVLTRSWMYHLRHPRVRMVAPTRAAHRQLLAIYPDAERVTTEIIGHGLPAWDNLPATAADSNRRTATGSDQRRSIRVLVLGRLQQGKGRQLLLDALPQFDSRIHLTALGCGKPGRALLGRNNVDVIMHYDWQQLPTLVNRIRPDVALLLSTVPETFSYTLSELRALQVPVIATRNGSFTERIEHGIDGLLIDSDSQALSDVLNGLLNNRIILSQLQQQATQLQPDNMQKMLQAYAAVWESIEVPARPVMPAVSKNDIASSQLLHFQRLSEWRGRALHETTDKLQQTYQQLSARLKHMRSQARDLKQLRSEQSQLQQALNKLTRQLRQTSVQLRNKEQHLLQTQDQLHHVQSQFDAIIASRSWKLTKPLRLMTRVLGNLQRHNAFNPLHWPQLFGKLIQRVHRNGFKATLRQLQESPEITPAGQYIDPEIPITPVDWQAIEPEVEQPQLHIVLMAQQQLAPLSALLNQLQAAVNSSPSQVHLLHDSSDPEINAYLEECQGLQLYSTAKHLFKALHTAYDSGLIRDILVINGTIVSSTSSLTNLLDPKGCPEGAMLISGIEAELEEPVRHPQQSYSRDTSDLLPVMLLFRDSGVDGLLDSKFPQQPLTAVLPDIAQLVQTYDGFVWQHCHARYRCLQGLPELVQLPAATPTVKPAILIIDTWVPTPDKDSGSMRMVGLLQLLLDIGWQVVFCPFNMRHEGRYTEALQNIGVQVWYQPYLNNFNQFLEQHGQQFQAVMLSRHQTAGKLLKAVRRYCSEALLIFDTVDLHYLREQREAELENSLQLMRVAEQTKRQELSIISKSDVTLVVSKAEQALLAETAPDSRVEILSNIHVAHGRRADYTDRQDLMFVGGFQHPPNLDAVRWLCREIWPLITERLPDAKLHIIGSKMPDEVIALADERIIVHGYVQNLDAFHDSCRLSVAPLRYGAGVKGKINSAMSFGLPVVATTTAVEGMDLHHEQQVLVGDDTNSFADAVVRLYTDQQLWQQLSDAGLQNVDEHFSPAAARSQLDKILPA